MALPVALGVIAAPTGARAAVTGIRPGLFTPKVREQDSSFPGPGVFAGNHPAQEHVARMVVADPSQAGVYWAIGFGSGVWKTTDGGRTWLPRSRGLTNLMLDALEVDPQTATTLYGIQSPSRGTGNGFFVRSTDAGATWEPRAICDHAFTPRQPASNLSVSDHPGGLRVLWAGQSDIFSDCGGTFRSDNAAGPLGDSWCTYLDQCDTLVPPLHHCASGMNWAPFNDGAGGTGISGTTEAYSLVTKNDIAWPCAAFGHTAQAQGNLVNWSITDDEYVGPVSPAVPKCPLGSAPPFYSPRTWQLDYDPDQPQHRFSSFRTWKLSGPQETYDLAIAYSDGTLSAAGRRQWNEALDVLSCFLGPSPVSGAFYDVRPVAVTNAGGEHRVFALAPRNFALMRCHGGADTTPCFSAPGWECIFNFGAAPQGCAAMPCPAGTDFTDGQLFDRYAISPALGPGGESELLFMSRVRQSRTHFLRISHDGAQWKGETLRDPVTCKRGIPLLTPLQVVDLGSRLVMTSPRQLFQSFDAGASWTPYEPNWVPAGSQDRGPQIAVSPSNPAVAYASNDVGLRVTRNGGTRWQVVDMTEWPANQNECLKDWDLVTPGVQGAGCSHAGRCGRVNRICASFNQIAVDPFNDDAVYAATQQGLWKWTYPFDGSSPCNPLIDWQAVSFAAALAVAETPAWVRFHDTCPPPNPPEVCVRDIDFLSVAPDPGNAAHILAGGRGGLYETTDAGLTWKPRTDVAATPVLKIAFAPAGEVFLATGAGVYKGGAGSPTPPFSLTLPGIETRDVAFRQVGPTFHVWAAGMDYIDSAFAEGVYESVDGGDNFEKIVTAAENQRIMSLYANTTSLFAGLLGEGLVRVDQLVTDCDRLASSSVSGFGGDSRLGWAVTALGEVPNAAGETGCHSRWAALEFQGSPLRAKVRILNDVPTDYRTPLLSTVDLSSPVGSLQGVGDVDPAGPPPLCPEVAVGLPSPLAGTGRVEFRDLCNNTLKLTLQPGAFNFGHSLARSGNLLAVGAPTATGGTAYVYRLDSLGSPPVTIPNPGGISFGWSLAFGDMNGDSVVDLAVGAPEVGAVTYGPGQVFVYAGPTWTLIRTIACPGAGCPGAGFGFSLSSGYDRFGLLGAPPDGSHDLAIGAPGNVGAAYWYASSSDTNPIPFPGPGLTSAFGWSVLLARDLTNDFLPDLVVGAPNASGTGAIHVYDGTTPVCSPSGPFAGSQLGASLAEAGDVDGSRAADIVVGQPETGVGTGTAYVRATLR